MAKSKPSKKKPAKKGGAKKSTAKKTAKAKPAAKKRKRKTEQREVAPSVSEETTDAPAAAETSETGEEVAETASAEESEESAGEAESEGGGVWGDKTADSEYVNEEGGADEEPQSKTIVEILSSKPAPVDKKLLEGQSDALFNTIRKHFRPMSIKEIQEFIKRNSYPFHCSVKKRSENSPEVYIMLTDGTNSVRCPLNKNEFITTQ